MPRAKVVEAPLRERADRLERELEVERASRLAQEQRAARCLELLRELDREGGRTREAGVIVARLRGALSGIE